MFFVVLLLMYSSSVIANGSDCCHKVMGSCRSACEQLYMDAIADLETKQQRLLDVKNFCSSSLSQFWKCVNETQSKAGDSNVWKSCCDHAVTDQCHQGCGSAESTNELTTHCRQSDEMYLFDCVEIKQEREECCGLARKPDCHGMCRRWVESPSMASKTLLANTCSSPVINCLATLVPRVPLRQPHKYLHCCEHSNVQTCRDACRSALKKQSGVDLDRLQENLDAAGCQPVSFHDKMWQCFLRSNQDPPIGNYEDPKLPYAVVMPPTSQISGGLQRYAKPTSRAGINDAKLHCCKKGVSSHCRKSCMKIFSSEFDWGNFEEKCGGPQEENMNQCFDEVTEPCVPGCKNMNFCTMFNNRPLDLFRSCSVESDKAAKEDYEVWVKDRKIELSKMEPLFLKNIEECSPTAWKAVACAMQLKPCERMSQSTRICKSSCQKLLRECLDESKHHRRAKEAKIAEVCNKLASLSPDETNCVSLERFLDPPAENLTEEYTTPCVPDNCGPAKFCEVRHHCPKDKDCDQHVCQSGCPVGQISAYVVPKDAYVPIPEGAPHSRCFKICQCKSRITDCEAKYCFGQEHCKLHDIDINDTPPGHLRMLVTDSYYTPYPRQTIPPRPESSTTDFDSSGLMHGSTLYIKCNLCVCNFGEMICSKRNCNETSPENNPEPSFFQLPCTCPPKYEPVCTVTGLTLQNECLAKCLNYEYSEGECTKLDSCVDGPGKEYCSQCISDPKVCLLRNEKDCPQHQCVASSGCQHLPDDPVCDEEGTTHKNPCYMVEAGKKMAYRGQCQFDCKDSTVCGVDGNMYPSECHATARYISVDYEGPCTGVGIVNNDTGEMEGCAKDVQCPPLPAVTTCLAYIPPGACCHVCAGAIRVLYSQKHIERAIGVLHFSSSKEFTVEKIMRSLNRHIDVAECAVYGHLTMENDLLVLVKSTLKEPTEQQLQVCVLEAEKLATLIQRGSPRIATDVTTSILVYAKAVHFEYVVPGSSAAFRTTPFTLVAAYLIVLAQ